MDPKNPSTVKTDNSFRRKLFWKSTNLTHRWWEAELSGWIMRKYFRLAKPSQSVEQLFPSRGLGWKSVIHCTYSGVKVPIVDLRWLWWQSRGELVEQAWRNCLTVGKYWCKQARDWDRVSQAPRPHQHSPTPASTSPPVWPAVRLWVARTLTGVWRYLLARAYLHQTQIFPNGNLRSYLYM